jgi:hypothetical protein
MIRQIPQKNNRTFALFIFSCNYPAISPTRNWRSQRYENNYELRADAGQTIKKTGLSPCSRASVRPAGPTRNENAKVRQKLEIEKDESTKVYRSRQKSTKIGGIKKTGLPPCSRTITQPAGPMRNESAKVRK